MNIVDPKDTFERMKRVAIEQFTENLQVDGNRRALRVSNVRVDDRLDTQDIAGQLDAKVRGATWGVPVLADVELVEKSTGHVLDRAKKVRIATLPKPTQRFSVIVEGTERIVRSQFRLRPGVYTVAPASGTQLKTLVNTSKGKSFSLHFDPQKADWTMEIGRAKRIPVYDVLKLLGISDGAISKAVGADTAALMAKKSRGGWTTDQLYKTIMPTAPEDGVDKAKTLQAYFEHGTALSPETTKITLGHPFTAANGEMMLAAVKRQLDISRGHSEVDERDSLIFKQIQMLDDHLKNRLEAQLNKTKRNGRMWHMRAKARIDRATNARDAMRRLDPNREITSFFASADAGEGSLAESAGLTNPARQLDVYSQTTVTGPGGTDLEKVTDLARSVHPSTLGIIDPVHTPEGPKVGIDTHLTIGVKRLADGNIGTEFVDARTGEHVVLTAAQASQRVIGFPEDYDLGKKKPRPRTREVAAISRGKQMRVPSSQIDYVMPDSRNAFDTTVNMVPWLDSVDGARGVMAAKMLGQAVSLIDSEREAPLVQTLAPSGRSFEAEVARLHLPKSPVDGTVSRITRDQVVVKDKAGESHKVGLYSYFPLLGKSGPMHDNTVTVKVGDRVHDGQILAESNFTKDGTLALGKNLTVAYIPYKGYNFEDGLVMSEGAARKMTSQHLHQYQQLREPNLVLKRDTWRTQFPSLWKSRFDSMFDEDGVIKAGVHVEPGDPLILGSRRKQDTRTDQTSQQIRMMLIHPFRNAAVIYDKDNAGVVQRVVKAPRHIEVHVYAEHPTQIGDKFAGRYGNKGIVSAIVPDSQMPHTSDGKVIDLLMNPMGVPGRINTAQLFETAVGKVGKKYVVHNFSPHANVEFVHGYMKEHGVSETDTIVDPTTKRRIPNIMVGKQYIMKLEHEAETKAGARGIGPYSMDKIPRGGDHSHPQKIDHLTGYALLAHGARANLRDFATYKTSQNDEVWRAISNLEPIPAPRTPWVYGKFEAMLKQLGVNTVRHGDDLRLQPLTDDEVKEMSAGEIHQARFVSAQNIRPERGGLFDPIVTGGMDGTKWSHFRLVEAIPNPTFESSITLLAGLTSTQFDGILKGELGVKAGRVVDAAQADSTRGAAIAQLLKGIDLPSQVTITRAAIRKTTDNTKRNRLYRKLRVLQNLQHMNVRPEKAFMVSMVPVMPPVYRPVYVVPGTSARTAPINYLYKDAINLNNKLKESISAGVPTTLPDFQKGMTELYQAVSAIQGYADPITKNKGYKGVMEQIAGTNSPKGGFFQQKLIAKKQDLSGRGPLINAPELHMDEVGIPKDIAWEMFKPFVLSEMVAMGYKGAQAIEEWRNRTVLAERALEAAAAKRPVWINRAPSLHRHSIMAFRPRLWNQKSIGLHPMVYKGFNADNDGDCALGSCLCYTSEMPHSSKAVALIPSVVDLASFPRLEETREERLSGVVEFDVPPGVYVPAYESGKMVLRPVTKYSVHPDCEEWHVVSRRGREIVCSSDHSLALLDSCTLDVDKAPPRESLGRCFPVMQHLPGEGVIGDLMVDATRALKSKHQMSSTVKLTFDVGWMIGASIGDGWVTQRNESSCMACISYGRGGEAVAQRWAAIIKSICGADAGIQELPHIFDGKECLSYRATVSSTQFGDWLLDLIGKGAAGKHLPEAFLGYPEEFRRGLLAGLLDTDATVSWQDRTHGGQQFHCALTTICRDLAEQATLLALSLGVIANKNPTPQFNRGKEVHVVRFAASSIQDAHWLDLSHPEKAGALRDLWASAETKSADREIMPLPARAQEELLVLLRAQGATRKKNRNKSAFSSYVVVIRADGWLPKNAARLLRDRISDADASDYLRKWFTLIQVDWDIVESAEATGERKTMYDITVPGPLNFTLANGAVVWDTLAIHVPVTPAAVEESKNFYPSLHPFSVGGQLLTAPRNESQWGLWMMTQLGEHKKLEFPSIADAAAAYNRSQISYTDVVRIGGKQTTYGRALVNEALPPHERRDDIVLDAKTTQRIIKDISKHNAKALAGTLDAFKTLGYAAAYEMGGSITLADVTPFYAAREKLLVEAKKHVKSKGVVEAYTPAIKGMQKAIHEGPVSNNLVSMLRSGALGKIHSVQQILGAGMLYTDSKGKPVPVAVKKSYSEGLDLNEYWAASYGARRGIIGRSLAVKLPGALAKDMAHTMMDQLITKLDCGTDRGITVPTEGLDAVGRFLARDLPGMSREHAITQRDVEALHKHGIGQVLVRSPITCLVGDGICARCWGIDENGQTPKVGENVGMRSGMAITEPSVQLSLSAFHTGGVYGATQMREDLFQEARNLLDVPQQFRNKATVAHTTGKVEKIEKNTSLGGWDVTIAGKKHYVAPRRKIHDGLLGKTVDVGDALTDGMRDPRELAKLIGFPNTQEYMADELTKTFAAGGVNQPRKHFESVIRAAAGTVQVLDDPHGRHEVGQLLPFGVVDKQNHEHMTTVEGADAAGSMLMEKIPGLTHLYGQILTADQVKQLGNRRIRVNQKPLRYEPLFPGVSWMPQKREDWLARLAYRGLEKTIRHGAAEGSVSKLHGLHPVPGWVVGSEIKTPPGARGEY